MSNASLTTTATQSGTAGASRTLPVLTLIVAGAAAALSVYAIATDDVGTPTAATVAVQQPAGRQAAPGSAVAPAPIVTIHRGVDGCGRPIVHGQASCW